MIRALLLLYFLVLSLANAADEKTLEASPSIQKIKLTQEEQKYLQEKEEIIVCDYANWMPYIGHENGRTFGIIYDYYKAFEARIGVPIKFVHMPEMEACVRMVTERKADAVASMGTPNTFSDMILSDEYGNDFVALVTQLKTPFVREMKDLKNKKVGVIGHYKNMIAYLHQNYPSFQFQITDSTEDGLKRVADGDLFAFIDIYRIAAYNIRQEHIGELKINTKIYPLVMRAHVGLRKDETLLRDIFNKAIADLSPEEKRKMIDQWMRAKKVIETNYILLGQIALFALLIILWLLYRQFKERRHQALMLSKQAKLAGMGTMIRNIAHQWRQPLSRINSNVTVMKMMLYSDDIQKELLAEKLDSIEENTQYMSDTIEDFMHFFHPDKQKTRVWLQKCVEKALHLTGIYSKNIKVSINTNKEIWVYTYEKELIQVILIILNNAMDNFKIRSVSDPRINIQIERLHGKAILIIQDNGGGIAEKEIDRIFEPYYTTKFKYEGTGLGLYMAKLLTENSMDGSLHAKNVGNGAWFEIKLPERENKDA